MASKEQIQTRINLADVQHEERKDNVQETLAFLRNDFSDVQESDYSDAVTLAPNFMMATKRRVLAQLYPGNPIFYARPRQRGFEGRARAISSLLEYYWDEIEAEDVMRDVIDDALTYGFGCVKTGYGRLQSHIDLSENEEEASERIQAELFDFMERNPVKVDKNQNHELDIQVKTQFLEEVTLLTHPDAALIIPAVENNIEEHALLLEEEKDFPVKTTGEPSSDWPFMERVSPDVFWDPMVTNPRKSAYVIHRIQRRLTDVKDDPLYKNTRDLQPDAFDDYSERIHDNSEDPIPQELALVTIYEIWDARDRTVGTWGRGHDKPLRTPTEEGWPSFIPGFPFHWFSITDLPGEFPAPPVMEYLKFAQRSLMRLYSELMTHSDRSSTKYIGHEDLIPETETKESLEDKLAGASDGIVIWGQSGQPIVQPLQLAQADPIKITLISLLQNVITENAGSSQTEIANTETATAASITATQVNILVADALAKVEKLQVSCAKDFLGLVRQFGPQDQTFRVIGPEGEEWVDYNINDVQASWQVQVEMPTPEQGERQKQNFLSLFNLFMPFLDPVGKKALVLDGLRNFGVKNVTRYLEDPPTEVIAHVELEHIFMSSGQMVEPREGEAHDEHLKLHMPFMQQLQQANAPQGQQGQQGQPPDEQAQQIMQLVQQHIENTQALKQEQGQPQGRRTKIAAPTGNPGRTESILSNQERGT